VSVSIAALSRIPLPIAFSAAAVFSLGCKPGHPTQNLASAPATFRILFSDFNLGAFSLPCFSLQSSEALAASSPAFPFSSPVERLVPSLPNDPGWLSSLVELPDEPLPPPPFNWLPGRLLDDV
jgi:hypothetical protein